METMDYGPSSGNRRGSGNSLQRRKSKVCCRIGPEALKGRRIEARGMLYSRNKQLRLRLRYHLDLKILNN